MKKLAPIIAVLFTYSVHAAVTISGHSVGNVAAIDYSISGPNSVRAFALDITVNSGMIADVNCSNPNYYIYPGSIVITDGSVIDFGSCVCDASKYTGTKPGIGTNAVTVEMGSLYTGSNKPPDSGTLLTFTVSSLPCIATIAANTARGGIVMENPDENPQSNLPVSLSLVSSGLSYINEPSLVSCWKFDETAGTTTYDSTGANSGTIHGNSVWTTGKNKGALQFDGVTNYVNVPDNASLRFSQSGSFTISCWAKPATDGCLVCKMKAFGNDVFGYALSWESSLSRFLFTVTKTGIGSTSIYTSDNFAPAGSWYHITAVYNNKNMKIYLNGQLHNSGTFAYDAGTSTPRKALSIGARSYDSIVTDYFTGVIDDVRIYNTALYDIEVQQLYRNSLCKNPIGDISEDNLIDMNDLEVFAAGWLDSPCTIANSWCTGIDLNKNNSVDFLDYALLVQNWLVAGNRAPDINAGIDQIINISDANLNGTVTDDGLPNPPGAVKTLWTVISGPGTVTFADVNMLATTANFSAEGTYVLRLTADDNDLSAYSQTAITYLASP